MILAPGASSAAVYAPGRHDPLPPVDARLVAPETHRQVLDGVTIETMGANPPHAQHHFQAAHVFAGTLAPGFVGAVDMLTRLNASTDLAPDVSVFPAAPDPVTGRRQLEHITFEVCDSEDTAHVTDKARRFTARGVRRVFYVQVRQRTVHEWDAAADLWHAMPPDTEIVDPCFAVPIPVAALVDRVLADDTVARALLAANNRVLAEALDLARSAALAQSVLTVLDARGFVVTDAQRAQVLACRDAETLVQWQRRAVTAATTDEALGSP